MLASIQVFDFIVFLKRRYLCHQEESVCFIVTTSRLLLSFSPAQLCYHNYLYRTFHLQIMPTPVWLGLLSLQLTSFIASSKISRSIVQFSVDTAFIYASSGFKGCSCAVGQIYFSNSPHTPRSVLFIVMLAVQ